MLLLNGHAQTQPFLDIGSQVYSEGSGEQGLLGLAFPADYAGSGLFYVDYTIPGNDIRVVQYRRSATNPNLADPASARILLTIDHHRYTNHNGGQLAFGPDGDLYIGVGDGGSEDDPEGNGQNTDTLLAKILRIDPSPDGGYTIPAGEPVRRAGRQAAGDLGLRAAQPVALLLRPLDRRPDHRRRRPGPAGGDRLRCRPAPGPAPTTAGASGRGIAATSRAPRPHAVFPVLIAPHSSGYCAIIGGYVVRDRSLHGLYGRYLFGDNCHQQIESVRIAHGRATRPPRHGPERERNVLLRRRRPRAHLHRLAGRAGVPPRRGR